MNIEKRNTWQYKLAAYMVSQGISLLGSSIVSLAVIWYVTLGTGSGSMVAAVTATTFLPQALIMLYGGVLADRFSPKRIVMISDSLIAFSTLILLILFAVGADSIGWVLFFNALRSLGTGIQLPATKSILPLIVPEGRLMKANSIFTGIWSVIQLVSPGLSGVIMSRLSISYVFLIDVITAIIGVLLLATVTIAARRPPEDGENTPEGLIDGFRYIMRSKTLRRSILLYTVFSFLVIPAAQLTPLLAAINVGSEVRVLSIAETAFSVGAFAVSFIMAAREVHTAQNKLVGLSSVLFGLSMLLLLPARGIVSFAALMALMGMGSPLYYTPLMTHIQENTEERYMGRTFSYVDMFSTAASPLGMAVFGPLANVSILIPFIIPGALLIALGVIAGRKEW